MAFGIASFTEVTYLFLVPFDKNILLGVGKYANNATICYIYRSGFQNCVVGDAGL